MQSEFWAFMDNNGSEGDRWGKIWDNLEIKEEAIRLLLLECPTAVQWRTFDDHFRGDAEHMLFDLITALAAGTTDDDSPKPQKYHPNNFTFHFGAYREMLFQHPVRGAVNVDYRNLEGDSFDQPAGDERFITLLRRTYWFEAGRLQSHACWGKLDGGAIVLIRGDKVDVYPYPENWQEVANSVRDELDHMTAREKAAVELPVVLKSFVDLLDWGPVMDQLEVLRPRDD